MSNLGIFLHALTNVFKFWKVTDELPGHAVANTIVAWTAWVMMITGQSVVLWSRLHLVAPVWWTRWILVVIIVDAIVLHTSTGVLTFLTNLSSDPKPYKGPYGVVEKLQVTLFFIQELILSGIYIWRTAAMLRSEDPLFKTSQTMRGSKGRKVLIHTIAMSAIIIALDIALVTIEFLRRERFLLFCIHS